MLTQPRAVRRRRSRTTLPRIVPGSAEPLGAHWTGHGTNFAIYSPAATRVDLCLLIDGVERCVPLPGLKLHTWHGYVSDIGPGTLYGFRVHGPWQPDAGLRFNPRKWLLDPYARTIAGPLAPGDRALPYVISDPSCASDEDSAGSVPVSVVTDDRFDWGDDARPQRAWADTVIYELHVKGFTQQHPDVPASLRGTYAGLAHPAAIAHLVDLGVTAVELMPVQTFVHEGLLVGRSLANYWGYNSIGFFAPHSEYAVPTGPGPVPEFKAMVKALHAAGLEVILDVVYNHTAEGNHMGPMLAFRGIDNTAYYRLVDGQPDFYMDYTGTGNSLNIRHPQTLRLVMDSLRYWTTHMHVDGFRFDLATTLGRAHGAFDRWSSFFAAVHQDPVLRNVKLIAEPWDAGDDGYQLGGFPLTWAEWNGRYRDSVRDLWRGERAAVGDFAARVVGSADLFASNGRAPQASVNFVVSHDGYTLRDLVSYHEKHNEANGENNLDGESTAHAWNLGVEGPTDDPVIGARRERQVRNFLATLLLSLGTPMIAHGDELGRTQRGNNNAYCHDSPLTWINWTARDRSLEAFARQVIAFRRQHSVLRTSAWVSGPDAPVAGTPVASWFRPDGSPMTPDDWAAPEHAAVTLVLQPADSTAPALCAIFAGTLEPHDFVLPAAPAAAWRVAIDTLIDSPLIGQRLSAGTQLVRPELSLLVAEAME